MIVIIGASPDARRRPDRALDDEQLSAPPEYVWSRVFSFWTENARACVTSWNPVTFLFATSLNTVWANPNRPCLCSLPVDLPVRSKAVMRRMRKNPVGALAVRPVDMERRRPYVCTICLPSKRLYPTCRVISTSSGRAIVLPPGNSARRRLNSAGGEGGGGNGEGDVRHLCWMM